MCMAYLQIEPREEAGNRRTASLMAQVANYAGRSLPDRKMVTADEYLGNPEPRQSNEDQKAFMKGLQG